MSERSRIDLRRDLSPEQFAAVRPDVERMAELEQRWVDDGDEDAFFEWKLLADRTFRVAKENARRPGDDEDGDLDGTAGG